MSMAKFSPDETPASSFQSLNLLIATPPETQCTGEYCSYIHTLKTNTTQKENVCGIVTAYQSLGIVSSYRHHFLDSILHNLKRWLILDTMSLLKIEIRPKANGSFYFCPRTLTIQQENHKSLPEDSSSRCRSLMPFGMQFRWSRFWL